MIAGLQFEIGAHMEDFTTARDLHRRFGVKPQCTVVCRSTRRLRLRVSVRRSDEAADMIPLRKICDDNPRRQRCI